jgi:hypothetical protein
MQIYELTQSTKTSLTESKDYKLWSHAGRLLVEAQLTADQIQQIFQQVQQSATAAGGNRTMIGQGKDAATAINKAWEDLKTKVQNSGPIKNVDSMYDQAAAQLKQATGGDQGVMQYVQKYRDFAKAHPVAQSLIYSALIAAAGISGAGAGGAAALGLFKLVDKLLQGEKFSSAAYSGAKTGAMAYGASKVGDYVKGAQQQSAVAGEKVLPVQGQAAPAGSGNFSSSNSYSGTLSGVTGDQITSSPVYQQVYADQIRKFGGGSPQAVQAAKQFATAAAKAAIAKGQVQESLGVDLSPSQVYYVIAKIVAEQQLNEGIMDTIKGAAGKAASWAQTKGQNLTTKVTADKLLQAWKKAGSPTDSLDVASIIQKAGVPSETIKQVYGAMKIPFAGEPGAGPAATRNIPVGNTAPAAARNTPATTAPTPATTAATPTPSNASGYAGVSQPGTVNYSGMAGSTAAPAANQPQQPNQTQGAASPAKPESTWQWLKREFKNVPKDIYTGGTAKGEVDAWKNAYKSGALSKALVGHAVAGLGNAIRRNAPYGHYDNSNSGESVRIKDAKGVEHIYTKAGNRWYSKDNKEVDAATAAMLNDRAEQQATAKSSTTSAPAADAAPATTSPATPTAADAGKTPEQIRIEKQKTAAAAAQQQIAGSNTVTPTPLQVGPGVRPQMTVAPSKVSFNTNLPTTQAAKKRTGGRVAGEPLSQTPNAVRKRAARLANKTTPAAAGANAFDQMTQQLTPQQKSSSTGGTIKQTPTGLVHTAKPAATTTPAEPVAAAANVMAKQKAAAKSAPRTTAIKGDKPGAPTPAEYAKLDQRLKQAMAAQGQKA